MGEGAAGALIAIVRGPIAEALGKNDDDKFDDIAYSILEGLPDGLVVRDAVEAVGKIVDEWAKHTLD